LQKKVEQSHILTLQVIILLFYNENK